MAVTRNPNLGPSQMRQRRRRLFLVRSSIILFIILVILMSLAIFSGHKKITIQTIIVSGNAAVQSDEVLVVANRVMTGRYWYLFARNNYFIFPRFQIKDALLNDIKTIKDADVSWKNWQTISIDITERRPYSVWCGNDSKIEDAPCYFVDNEGYIYSQAPVFSGTMFIRGYSNVSTSTSEIGQYFLPTKIYTQIFSLIDMLNLKKIKVISVSFDGEDYKFGLEKGPDIIFNGASPFESSFSNLFSAIETKNLDLEKDVSIINYIDLRFDNKIVVGKK